MMFAMGLYALFETDFRRWVNELGMQHYWTGVYILLAAGVLTMIQVFFGVLGAYQKKRTYLHVVSTDSNYYKQQPSHDVRK